MELRRQVLLLKVAVWLLGLTPVGLLVYSVFAEGFPVDPIERLTHGSGQSALIFLLATLTITPLRRLTGLNILQKVRRLLGLFSFFYAAIHFSVWIGLDQRFAWSRIVEDVAERPFVTSGMAAFLMLVPLAITSTRGWIRRLGKRWKQLHRFVYAAAGLGVVHFLWATKASDFWPFLAAGALATLLLFRIPARRRRKRGGR